MTRENNPHTGREMRKFKRYPLVGNCRLFVGDDEKGLHAMIENINSGGIGLHRKTAVPVNEPVRIELKFLNKEGDAFVETIEGKIVQVTHWKNIFIIGIAFTNMLNIKDHPHLVSYLKDIQES